MNYQDLKLKQRKEFDTFPIFFAFSNKQLEEGKAKLNVKENREICRVCSGGYIRKTDSDKLSELLKRHSEELSECLSVRENLIEALEYELMNHEYSVSYDVTNALDALNLDADTVDQSALNEAIDRYMSNVVY